MPLNNIRVFGGAIDRDESYVDLTLVGVQSDGAAVFEDGSGESHTLEAGRVSELGKQGLALDQSKDPGRSNLWNALDRLESQVSESTNNFAKQALREAARSAFTAVAEEERDKPNGGAIGPPGQR